MAMTSPVRPLRVILADPPLAGKLYCYQHPTLGILYIAGAIKKAFSRRDVEVAYLMGFGTLSDHLKAIAAYRPDVYGISFKTPMARLACDTMIAVRRAFPKLPVIAGGVHCTALPEDILDHAPADACFRGEAEQSFVDFISRFSDRRPVFHGVPGAIFRDNGSYIHNRPAPMVRDLDTFAWPNWDLIDPSRFPGMNYEKSRPSIGVVISRGCPWKCTFCSEPIWKINGSPTFRARSVACIVDEIEFQYRRGVREIRLICEELNANIKWACDLLNRIAALNHRDLFLNSNIRADRVTPQLADAMRAANMWLVCAGIESASQHTLNGILKEVRREQIEASCELLTSRGVKVLGYFLLYPAWEVDGQLQYERPPDALRTIGYAARLWQLGLLHYMHLSLATPRPGAPMWDLAQKHHLFRIPSGQPFYYLAEGMALPGVSWRKMQNTLLVGRTLQGLMAVTSGNRNPGVVARGIRKSYLSYRTT
jgi:anaerobic magnesium-protoporphyrin IX monomethyl ester cyclase